MLLLDSPLLHRARTAILVVLLLVLPLQGAWQWVAGLQAARHVHATVPRTASPPALGMLLDRLHAAQPARLQVVAWSGSRSAAEPRPHAHGGHVHVHAADEAGVVPVADADDGGSAGVTAFIAWIPAPLGLPAARAGDLPRRAAVLHPGRVATPPTTPPRA